MTKVKHFMDMYEPMVLELYPSIFRLNESDNYIYMIDASICSEPMIFYKYDSVNSTIWIKPMSNVYRNTVTIQIELCLNYQSGLISLGNKLCKKFRKDVALCIHFFENNIDIGHVTRTYSIRNSTVDKFDRQNIMRSHTIKQIIENER